MRRIAKASARMGPGLLVPKPIGFRAGCHHARRHQAVVRKMFPKHPGDLDQFDWPVTAARCAQGARRFHRASPASLRRLRGCDVDWARGALSFAAFLGDESQVARSARGAGRGGEGLSRRDARRWRRWRAFIRQILGWREYVRGVYLPSSCRSIVERNHLQCPHAAARVLLDGRDGDELPAPRADANPRRWATRTTFSG